VRNVDRLRLILIDLNIQRSHQADMEFRSRWTFFKTYPSLCSVAHRQVSSAKRASFTPIVWGVSLPQTVGVNLGCIEWGAGRNLVAPVLAYILA
jgi:hypothetical protein